MSRRDFLLINTVLFVERYKDFMLDKARKSNCKYIQAFILHQHKIIWLKICHMSEVSLNELFLTRPCRDLLSKIWPYGSLYFTCPWKGVLEGGNLNGSIGFQRNMASGLCWAVNMVTVYQPVDCHDSVWIEILLL